MGIEITGGREKGVIVRDTSELDVLEPLPELHSWALHTYLRCEFRCDYCITGAQGISRPVVSADEVGQRLREHIERLPPINHVAAGAYADCYPNVESEYAVTRRAMEVLVELGIPVTVTTKGPLVLRDLDLLQAGNGNVTMSLISADQADIDRIEPHAPSAKERVDAIHTLFNAGITVNVSVVPWMEGITNLASVVDALDPRIPIRVSPVRLLPPFVQRTKFGQRWTQIEVNDAYLRERSRWADRDNVWWGALAPEDSCRAAIDGLIGSRTADVRSLPRSIYDEQIKPIDPELQAASTHWSSAPRAR